MAELNLNAREKARLEEEKKNRKIRTKYIIVGVIVVLMIALVIFVNSRLFYTTTTALTVGDTSYSVARVNYEYSKMYMTYYQYGIISSSTDLSDTCSFDADGGTWDDYFKKSAKSSLTEFTAEYEAALAATDDDYTTLTDDEAAEIDEAMETYKTYAKSYGYSSLNKFLSAQFGTGNSESTIRSYMKQELIVSRYETNLSNSFEYTDEELREYYEENAGSYDKVDYLYTLISAAANEDEGIDEETALAAAEDTAKVIVAGTGDTEEGYRDAVLAETGSDPTETSYTVTSFLNRFDGSITEDEIAEGKLFTHSTDSGVYVVYVLGTESADYPTVSVRHILIQVVDSDGDGEYSDEEKQTAYDAVKAIEDEWLAGDATEESFAALANEKSEDTGSNTNGGLYENIYKGQMVTEFNDFCFAGHEHGDTAIVYGETSSYAGYHLVYFVGEGQSYALYQAETTLRSSDYDAAIEEITANFTGEAVEKSGWRLVMAA
jgi:parvulin-like peptidyl-prolyl isomerase